MSGPGLKSADERTLEYLREVAIQAAKDLAAGKLKKKPRKKNLVDKVHTVCVEMIRSVVRIYYGT